ncbi:MarR family winged helix-turn-helix transcriptional regulator [Novosphingobium aquimarinum]|uniref:MarR family winged helix-turn-helix transcriptional regulator n=1 Tax=Novosphingobium aquimarinum TaxID=2682494 RepID=UPI0012EC00E3|nr:MarR family transcriptional regulator [Novosphingobium aquimarinum]
MSAKAASSASSPSLLHLVKQVQYKAYLRLEDVFQPLGITAVQFRILTTLSTSPGMSSAELARLYDVKPQTMIKQVATLERKSLIERRNSETNRKLLELRLTDEGKRVLAECRGQSRAVEASVLSSLDETEQATLRDLLSRLLSDMAEDDFGEAEGEFSREFARSGVQRV